MIGEPAEEQPAATLHSKTMRIPKHLASGTEQWLQITDEDWMLYVETLDALSQEFQHLARRDIDETLGELTCDLFVNRLQYRDASSRVRKLRQFGNLLRHRLEPFAVLIQIDHVSLGAARLRIGAIELFRLTRREAARWQPAGHSRARTAASDLAGKTVALARVQAGSPAKAQEIAEIEVDTALHALRFCLADLPHYNVLDEQMLFRRGPVVAVTSLTDDQIVSESWQRGFLPIELQVDRPLRQPIRDSLAQVASVVAGTPQSRLTEQLRRALDWLGTSITREHFDDKVVDLCTALEAMLTTKADKKKGEAIALRSTLLSLLLNERSFDPAVVSRLYELRSRVVHGSARRVCGEREYLILRALSMSTLRNVAALVNKANVKSIRELIAALETESLLRAVIRRLNGRTDPAAKKIAEFARNRLALSH